MMLAESYSLDGDACLAALRSVPLFTSIPDDLLFPLTSAVLFRKIPAGLRIIEEGQPGGELFIFLSGAGKVVKADGGVVLASLGPGDYVGEMSLIDGEPRSASVEVTETAELMVIGQPHFQDIMVSEPALMLAIMKVLSQRLRTTSARISGQDAEL